MEEFVTREELQRELTYLEESQEIDNYLLKEYVDNKIASLIVGALAVVGVIQLLLIIKLL